jgi:type IV secretory pathway VirB10-like protein
VISELPAPPQPTFVEVVVPSSSIIKLNVQTSITSETARVEDRVEARVTRDVIADGRVAIPAGTRVLGDVTLVERGGKMKDKARLGVRFHTLVLADNTQVPFRTDAIFREGSSPGNEASRKIGGAAIGGAILGAIIGGAKGAAIGGATGAAGGSAVVMAGDRNAATLPAGTVVTVRLNAPVAVDVEREQ